MIAKGADPVEMNTHIKSLKVSLFSKTNENEFEQPQKSHQLPKHRIDDFPMSDDILNSSDSALVNVFEVADAFTYKGENMFQMLQELGENPDEDLAINAQYRAGRYNHQF